MVSFRPSEPEPNFTGLAVPTHITFRAATANKSVYLSAYCDAPDRVVRIIQHTVQLAGGMSVCKSIESDSCSRQVFIGAQLPGLSSSDIWKVRAAIQRVGGIVETVRVNYLIRQPIGNSHQRPQACVGCRHYYGKSHGNAQLICAVHPYGPRDENCLDWEASNG